MKKSHIPTLATVFVSISFIFIGIKFIATGALMILFIGLYFSSKMES